jgi:hypothetical protein
LAGEFELMLAQVFLQRLHFLHMLICHSGLRLGSIKDETGQLVKGQPWVRGMTEGIDGDLRGCL